MMSRLWVTGLLLVGSGCHMLNPAGESQRETLRAPFQDPRSQEVFMPLLPALTFARSEPHLSAHGRDFLHLMPVQTSQNGFRVIYLWLGYATTIDRRRARDEAGGLSGETTPVGITLGLEDGEVYLPVVAWQGGELLDAHVTIPSLSSYRTALSREDYARLSRRQPHRLILRDEAGGERTFIRERGTWASAIW